MNINQMRKIDLYAGGTACVILGVYENIKAFLFKKDKGIKNINRILVSKYIGMGSILLATPMLRELRSRFPESRITLLSFESNAAFAEQLGLFDEVISIRTSSLPLFAKDLLKILLKNRRDRYDIVFDLEFFARFSTIVSYMSGARIRIGYYLPKLWRGNFLTYQVHFNPYKHVTEIFGAQLLPLGIKVSSYALSPPRVNEDKERAVLELLESEGLKDGEHSVTVNVNSSDLSIERRWPKEYFVELITRMLGSARWDRVVLVGAGDEADYVAEMHAALPEDIRAKAINLSGRLDIQAFIAMLKLSELFITNDSGPLHIASALGTPTISFFGPETPSLYGPLGKCDKTFFADLYCSPCLNVYNAKQAMCNGDNRCMKEIKPSEVIEALKSEGNL